MTQKTLTIVPESIKRSSQSEEFITFHASGDVTLCQRLISNLEMEYVWKEVMSIEAALESQCEYAEANEIFSYEFFQRTCLLRQQWKRMSKTPTKVLENKIKKIRIMANELATELKSSEEEIFMFHQIHLGLWKYIVKSATENDTSRALNFDQRIKQFHSELFAQSDYEYLSPDLVFALMSFAAELANPTRTEARYIRPTKTNDKNAERTFCVRSLASFFLEKTGRPRFDIVAPTVSTVLDLDDGGLSPDHASKLARDIN